MPTSPFVSRNATRYSPSTLIRIGGQAGSGSSSGWITGSQKRRNSSPIGVPLAVCVISALSCAVSIVGLCSSGRVRPLGPYVGMTVPTYDLSYAQAVVIVIQIGGVVPYRSAMADIVLGVGTSHTPQISVPWAE